MGVQPFLRFPQRIPDPRPFGAGPGKRGSLAVARSGVKRGSHGSDGRDGSFQCRPRHAIVRRWQAHRIAAPPAPHRTLPPCTTRRSLSRALCRDRGRTSPRPPATRRALGAHVRRHGGRRYHRRPGKHRARGHRRRGVAAGRRRCGERCRLRGKSRAQPGPRRPLTPRRGGAPGRQGRRPRHGARRSAGGRRERAGGRAGPGTTAAHRTIPPRRRSRPRRTPAGTRDAGARRLSPGCGPAGAGHGSGAAPRPW